MKKIYFALFALAILAISCKKDRSSNDNGCISRITELPTVSATDNAAALALLHNNQIPTEHLVVYHVTLNDEVPISAQQSENFQFVYANQVFNGLPVLWDNVSFTFEEGTLQSTSGHIYSAVNLDTKSTLELKKLRSLFLDEAINRQGITNTLRDSCLVAQFGYYNIRRDTAGAAPNFIKAWMVKPAHSEYPQAIYRDDNGQKVYFTAGYILF